METAIFGIGIMSGTSLDGLDLAYCQFIEKEKGKYSYEIVVADTCKYPNELKEKLRFQLASKMSSLEFCIFNVEYGSYIGEQINQFINKHSLKIIHFVASHGHTIFHQPQKGLTVQIGHPASIAAQCNLTVIADFRTLDVALGGQGAPLVPIGDQLFFGEFDFCINMGGIVNISFKNTENSRIAMDVCPGNLVFNYLAELKGKEFDDNGDIARSGKILTEILEEWENNQFYLQIGPQSLGKEWVDQFFIDQLEKIKNTHKIEDLMATTVEHASSQISKIILSRQKLGCQVLITGGGAFNKHLINIINLKCQSVKAELTIPSQNIVQFKEALIFAFLGLQRFVQQTNTLSSVTGASRDSIGGCIYNPL